ncbi:MAG: serine/threonine-protein kinase [Sorangiineae bacterium]|nr:serine/threonine-protein kinase [Polyangiaceae bacterium]MEB2323629.1 serine/threonine-protein kinase [Sorangiineae bacterium]
MFFERTTPRAQLGPYELLRLLATGGMAEVYEARRGGPHGFARRVALKRMLPQLLAEPRAVAMFCDEARVHAGLYHPNLVQVLDFGEHEGEPFLVMELVEGPTLAELLSAVARRRRTVELGVVLTVGQQVLRALDHVHHARDDAGRPLGLVHRDVTPGNVLIGKAGEVKLGDFGIIRGDALAARTEPGELKGKLGYVSPEQAVGAPVDPRSDLFSLGVTLAELLLGRALFSGRSELEVLERLHAADLGVLRTHGAHIPPDVHAVLAQALARRPADRFESAWEFGVALGRCIERHPAGVGAVALAEWLRDLGIAKVESGISVAPPARALAAVGPAFRLRRPGGRMDGPYRLAELLGRFATGRVPLDAEVAKDDGPFVALAELGELARFTASPAYRALDEVTGAASERWRVEGLNLPWVLFALARRRRTGVLLASNGHDRKRLYFVDGGLEYTVSSEPTELLGISLVTSGLVERGVMERAIERTGRGGRRLGEALVADGALRPSALLAALAAQRRTRLAHLCQWRSGELAFIDGVSSREAPATAAYGALPLLRQIVLEAHSPERRAELLAPWRWARLRRSAGAAHIVESLQPTAELAAALARADGRSLDELADGEPGASAADAELAARAVFLGLCSGALEV